MEGGFFRQDTNTELIIPSNYLFNRNINQQILMKEKLIEGNLSEKTVRSLLGPHVQKLTEKGVMLILVFCSHRYIN